MLTDRLRDHEDPRVNILFVCSRNQWRSPTAERVWRDTPGLAVRSAGTRRSARHTVTEGDVAVWVDIVCVLEKKHRSRLTAEFAAAIAHKPIHVLDIPDESKFMDPELFDLLRDSVGAISKRYTGEHP